MSSYSGYYLKTSDTTKIEWIRDNVRSVWKSGGNRCLWMRPRRFWHLGSCRSLLFSSSFFFFFFFWGGGCRYNNRYLIIWSILCSVTITLEGMVKHTWKIATGTAESVLIQHPAISRWSKNNISMTSITPDLEINRCTPITETTVWMEDSQTWC